jgi:hypothetical protein
MEISGSVNISQLAQALLEWEIRERRKAGETIDESKLTSLRAQLVERWRDFLCVLKFGHSHQDLLEMGDTGIIKIIQLFGISSNTDRTVQQRCADASLNGDKKFLNKVDDALKLQRKIHGRIRGWNLFMKAVLFLNWETPFFLVNTPLRFWTNQ